MQCINLEARFPGYRIGYEDKEFVATQDPWHKILICRAGHIAPAGGSKLWACTKSRTVKAAKAFLDGLDGCEVKQNGDDGVSVEFDLELAPVVFKLMGAKKK